MNSLILLLANEIGGRATPLARIADPSLLRAAGEVAIRQQRATTRKLERDCPGLAPASKLNEQVLKKLLRSSGAPRISAMRPRM